MVCGAPLESGKALSSDWPIDSRAGNEHGNVREEALGGSLTEHAVIHNAMHEIAARKGNFTLFALLRRADALGKWDLVASAPWLEGDSLKATRELVDLLAKSIGRKLLQQFARVAPVPSDSPVVTFFLTNFPLEDGIRIHRSYDLLRLEPPIEEAVIFRACRPGGKRRAGREPHPTNAEVSRSPR
jgi:hypothetical protein